MYIIIFQLISQLSSTFRASVSKSSKIIEILPKSFALSDMISYVSFSNPHKNKITNSLYTQPKKDIINEDIKLIKKKDNFDFHLLKNHPSL